MRQIPVDRWAADFSGGSVALEVRAGSASVRPPLVLLESQKNEIFRVIQGSGVDVSLVDWEVGPGFEKVVHRPSGHHFTFRDVGTRPALNLSWTPGEQSPSDVTGISHWTTEVQYLVSGWLTYLKRELAEPDLWGELVREREALGPADLKDAENTPFTAEEQREIAERLAEVKEYVRQTQVLTDAQFRVLNDRLDYLADAATRVPRIDWRNTLVGALVGQVLQGVLPPEAVRDVVGMIWRGLAQLFGVHLPPELPY
jgi:hypothetical protein